MSDAWITLDDTLIVIHRLTTTLLRAIIAGDQFRQQLHQSLENPKPLDWVLLWDSRDIDLPAALKIGQLIFYEPPQEGTSCLHTVKLLDGTITTWKNRKVVKIPTAIFNMVSQPPVNCDLPSSKATSLTQSVDG